MEVVRTFPRGARLVGHSDITPPWRVISGLPVIRPELEKLETFSTIDSMGDSAIVQRLMLAIRNLTFGCQTLRKLRSRIESHCSGENK
jgi:hypothetical protein